MKLTIAGLIIQRTFRLSQRVEDLDIKWLSVRPLYHRHVGPIKLVGLQACESVRTSHIMPAFW